MKELLDCPKDVLLLIFTFLPIHMGHSQLGLTCRRLNDLFETSTIKEQEYKTFKLSLNFLLKTRKSLVDPSSLLRVDYGKEGRGENLQEIMLFLIQHSLTLEFERFVNFHSSGLTSLPTEVKEKALKLAFSPKQYSKISLGICFGLIQIKEIGGETKHVNETFLLGCSVGEYRIVSILIQNPKLTRRNQGFQQSCKRGKTEIVELLLSHPLIDPSSDNGRADPSAHGQNAIRAAVKYGNLEAVQALLSDERVNPSLDYNACVREACMRGRLECLKLLIAHPLVNPSDRDNFGVRCASLNGFLECVEVLLADCRVDPSAENCQALEWALGKRHVDIVRVLLLNERIQRYLPSNLAKSSAKLLKKAATGVAANHVPVINNSVLVDYVV